MQAVSTPRTGALKSPALQRARQRLQTPAWHEGDGTTRVTLEGSRGVHVRLLTSDYLWVTQDPRSHIGSKGPSVTRTRWFLGDGEVRAHSLRDGARFKDFSYSIAALIARATDGDWLEIEDVLDLLPHRLRIVRRPASIH